MPTTFFRARHVATMTQPLIEDGVVAVDGDRIVAVGPRREINPPRVDHEIDGLLMPGLINAHTHLELSDRTPGDPPTGGFGEWLAGMIRRSAVETGDETAIVTNAVAIGIAQCRKFGVTTAGDISRHSALTRPLLRSAPLRVVSFGEVTAMGPRRGFLQARLDAAMDSTLASNSMEVGVTPHAPYSVEMDAYRACLAAAKERKLPLSTHLAEAADEAQFIAEHGGSLANLWDILGPLDAATPKFAGGPIRLAKALGLLDYPTLLAHVNYCDDAEMQLLAAGRAGVVWCPRTHAHFGHPPHRWRAMRAAGIAVSVGTDSCASSPDLNIVDDLRLIRRLNPDLLASELWELVTIAAARTLRWNAAEAAVIGQLAPGAFADIITWPTRTSDPLAEILDSPAMLPGDTYWNGQPRD